MLVFNALSYAKPLRTFAGNARFNALSYAKPLRTFAGNARFQRIVLRKTAPHFCWKCSFSTHYPTQNRFALLLEMLRIIASGQAFGLPFFVQVHHKFDFAGTMFAYAI